MVFKLNIKKLAGSSTPASPSFEAADYSYLSDIEMKLTIGGLLIYEGTASTFAYTYDDTNIYQSIYNDKKQVLRATSAVLNSGCITIAIPQLEIQDNVLVELELTSTVLHSFSNSFYIYGYDTEINVVTKTLTDEFTYPDFVLIPTPFTNYVRLYKNTALDDFENYTITNSENTITTDSQNYLLLLEESSTNIEVNCTSVSYDYDYTRPIYMPNIETTIDGNFDSENSLNIVDGNVINTYLDFANVTVFKQNNIDIYPCNNILIIQTVAGLEENRTFVNKTPADEISNQTISYTMTSTIEENDVIVNVEAQVHGDLELITEGSIEAGYYYCYSYGEDETIEELDDITISDTELLGGRLYITVLEGGTPTNWVESKKILSKVITVDEGTPDETLDQNALYKILKVEDEEIIVGINEFLLGSLPVQGTDQYGINISSPYKTYLETLVLDGTVPYTVEQQTCSSLLIRNLSTNYELSLSVYPMLDNGDFSNTSILDGTLSKYGNDDNFSLLNLTFENFYKIVVTINDTEFEHYFANFCSFKNCFYKYLDELICCNTTNCDTNLDCKCFEKSYYDFNAFMTLGHSVLALLNNLYIDSKMFRFLIDVDTEEKIKKMQYIKTLIDRASEYCLDCQKINSSYSPCKGC